MITQYPHTISLTSTVAGSKDGSGNWVAGSSTTVNKSGRYEPQRGDGTVQAADGTRINYDGIIYLPLPMDPVAPGTPVIVKQGATVLLKNTVKRFNAGQLNARIWL